VWQLFDSGDGSNARGTAAYLDGTVTMHLSENQTMVAHRRYVVAFTLTNPAYEQSLERTILLSSTGSANAYVSHSAHAMCIRMLRVVLAADEALMMLRRG
jgi:hypothetical protein